MIVFPSLAALYIAVLLIDTIVEASNLKDENHTVRLLNN